MTIGVMQPYFFPYLPYFQLIAACDKFVLLDDVNYINKGWINRNEIKSGKFTIALKGASQNREIRDIEIMQCNEWPGKFLNQIVQDYTGAPYFKVVWDMLERVLVKSKEISISKVNYLAIVEVCRYLDIRTQIVPSSSIYPRSSPGQYRIIEICQTERATRYINAIGGKELYDKGLFAYNGIDLKFINGTPTLSMIDVLMHNSKDEIRKELYGYSLE